MLTYTFQDTDKTNNSDYIMIICTLYISQLAALQSSASALTFHVFMKDALATTLKMLCFASPARKSAKYDKLHGHDHSYGRPGWNPGFLARLGHAPFIMAFLVTQEVNHIWKILSPSPSVVSLCHCLSNHTCIQNTCCIMSGTKS